MNLQMFQAFASEYPILAALLVFAIVWQAWGVAWEVIDWIRAVRHNRRRTGHQPQHAHDPSAPGNGNDVAA